MTWRPYQNGDTIGTAGPFGGTILRDEEVGGYRLTMEMDSPRAPFAITTSGRVSTAEFLSGEKNAVERHARVRSELLEIAALPKDEAVRRLEILF